MGYKRNDNRETGSEIAHSLVAEIRRLIFVLVILAFVSGLLLMDYLQGRRLQVTPENRTPPIVRPYYYDFPAR